MYYVYIIRSVNNPDQIYVGYTENLDVRISQHNNGTASIHTKKYMPWEIVTYTAISDKLKAHAFEKYLKSGSGRVFRDRHLI